ncbi:hypothetical protein V8F20_006918 [Naviculisporaceae sp. PSN 640]
MSLRSLVAAAVLSSPALAQWLVEPPTTAPADTVQDCTYWTVAGSSDTCRTLADDNFISVVELQRWNPSLAKTGCPVISGYSYCVEKNYGQDPPISTPKPTTTTPGPITTSSTTTPRGPTTTGNGISTPWPIQTGMVGNCNKFFFNKEGSGYCADIASKNAISLANFYAWNPAVGSNCEGLWLDTYYCVGIIGGPAPITTSTAKPTTTTSTKPGNGITTPLPTQSGMATNCNTFHKTVEGDTCASIAEKKGITLASFYSWNKGVGSNCEYLWKDTYYCVNIIGGTTLKPTTSTPKPITTTTKGNGVPTPTPIQSGMVTNCNKFHFVKEGEGLYCGDIATKYKISLANFYKWNPGVGSNCGSLWANYYVCVGTL